MAIEEIKFAKSAPPITTEFKITGGNESPVTDASGQATPQGNTSDAVNAGGLGRELPNKTADEQQNKATYASKDGERRAAELDLIVSARGLSNEEKNNVIADVGSRTSGGKVMLGDVVASEQRVTGNVSDLPPEVLAMVAATGNELSKNGATMSHDTSLKFAGVAKPQQQENGVAV